MSRSRWLCVRASATPPFSKMSSKAARKQRGTLTCGLKIYEQVCEVGLEERLATAKMTATLQLVVVLDCGAYMSKNKRNRAKRRPAGVRQRRAGSRTSFIREPWYAEAAKSIGITYRDQPRRAATGPNVLPP